MNENKKYEGKSASFTKTISESDVYLFGGITGDLNPMHINENYASQTQFEGRIVHGVFMLGLISNVIGMQLPGPGTIYMSQTANFLKPVKIGETITAVVVVAEVLNSSKGVLKLNTNILNEKDDVVVRGEAIVKVPFREEIQIK